MNERQGTTKIGAKNKVTLVLDRVETNMKYQGSYNFAETSVVGLDKHKKNDVEPHHKDAKYIDPPERFEPLVDRFFFEYVLQMAGAEAKKAKVGTYEDDIREDPLESLKKKK
jgi:hypothetical protein